MKDIKKAAQEIRQYGRYGDTVLAHINPEEAQILKALGGSGTINPDTGLPEYLNLGKALKFIAPVAALIPGVGTAIGTALGASAAAAPIVGSAALGAAGGLASGGGIEGALKGAALGGLLNYGATSISNAFGAGAAGANAAADAAFVAADAAQLAGQGLSQNAIVQNLTAAGVTPFVAADAAQLALQGLSQDAISQALAQSGGANIFESSVVPGKGISTDSLLRAGGLTQGLLGQTGIQQAQQAIGGGGGRAGGQVDYSGLMKLLETQAKTPSVASLLAPAQLAPEFRRNPYSLLG